MTLREWVLGHILTYEFVVLKDGKQMFVTESNVEVKYELEHSLRIGELTVNKDLVAVSEVNPGSPGHRVKDAQVFWIGDGRLTIWRTGKRK